MDTTSELASTASSADPRVGRKAASVLRRLAETLEAAQVASARRQGWSWQDIADVLGVTKQAVHHKHASAQRKRGARDV